MRQITLRFAGLLVSAGLLTALPGFVHADVPKFDKQLLGVWTVVAAVEGDRDDPFASELRSATVIVTDKTVVIVSRDSDVMKGPFTVALQEKGQHFIDFEWKRQKVQGIFRIKDNDLTLCFDRTGKERPAGFQVGGDKPGYALVKLERLSADPRATLPESELKWARDLVADYMAAVLQDKIKAANLFFTEDYSKTRPLYHLIQDPSVDVIIRIPAVGGRSEEARVFSRKVRISLVFERYEILSETVSPDRAEILFKGTFRGKKTELEKNALNREECEAYDERAGTWIEEKVTKGTLGERTGSYTLRVAKDKKTERWGISYFRWRLDPLPKKE